VLAHGEYLLGQWRHTTVPCPRARRASFLDACQVKIVVLANVAASTSFLCWRNLQRTVCTQKAPLAQVLAQGCLHYGRERRASLLGL
jgi:hypothetical protein